VRHPNLWVFLRKLKDEERRCRRQLHAAPLGEAPALRKRTYRALQERIGRLQQEYRAGHRSAEEYWTAVSYAVHQFN